MSSQSASPFDYHDCPDTTCGQSFATLDAFHKHWTRHRGRCPFPECETPIRSKYNFGRHCARKHSDYFIEYQHVEMTACKYHCGKVYSKANVSNLRRHEKTCSQKRDRQQPVDGDLRSPTVEENIHSSTSRPPQNFDTDSSNSPPDRHELLEDQHSEDETSGEETTLVAESDMVKHAFEVRSTYCARAHTLTTTKIIEVLISHNVHNLKNFRFPRLHILNEMSNFTESFAAVLASIKLDLDSSIIFLALVLHWELSSAWPPDTNAVHFVVCAALMLAEILCDDEILTAVLWAKATGIPEVRIGIMRETFYKDMNRYHEEVRDRGKIMEAVSNALARSCNTGVEGQDPSPPSLLMQLMHWTSRNGRWS